MGIIARQGSIPWPVQCKYIFEISGCSFMLEEEMKRACNSDLRAVG